MFLRFLYQLPSGPPSVTSYHPHFYLCPNLTTVFSYGMKQRLHFNMQKK